MLDLRTPVQFTFRHRQQLVRCCSVYLCARHSSPKAWSKSASIGSICRSQTQLAPSLSPRYQVISSPPSCPRAPPSCILLSLYFSLAVCLLCPNTILLYSRPAGAQLHGGAAGNKRGNVGNPHLSRVYLGDLVRYRRPYEQENNPGHTVPDDVARPRARIQFNPYRKQL